MGNPLFERFGQMNGNLPGPLQNMANFMSSFNQFQNSLGGNQNDQNNYAQQQIQQMLNSGKITQDQLNQVMGYAQMLQNMMRK